MKMHRRFLTLGLAGSALSDCGRDRCLRAVREPGLQGILDCASYLRTTVTPATITATETFSYAIKPVVESDVTNTKTIEATTTTVVLSTSTSLSTSYFTVTQSIAKRQVTVVPKKTPSYAAICKRPSKYVSACKCLGARATTTTVATPSTILTTSTTSTVPTSTRTTTIDTISTTTTDATQIVTSVTTTVSNVPQPIATVTLFALQVLGGDYSGDYLTSNEFDARGYHRMGLTDSPARAFLFRLTDGQLYSDKYRGSVMPTDYDASDFYLTMPGYYYGKPLSCALDGLKVLSCSYGTADYNEFHLGYMGGIIIIGPGQQAQQNYGGYPKLTFKAVKPPQ